MSIYKNGKLIAGGRQCMPLLSFMWADHQLNHPSWLRADTFSWQSGTVYTAVYQHLVDDYNNIPTEATVYVYHSSSPSGYFYRDSYFDVSGANHPYAYAKYYNDGSIKVLYADHQTGETTDNYYENADGSGAYYSGGLTSGSRNIRPVKHETINGNIISFYEAQDGHKIAPDKDALSVINELPRSQESNVAAIYAATGVAWYYIIDTTNQRFKLPRTKFGFTGLRTGVGGFVEAGLPNPNISVGIKMRTNRAGISNDYGTTGDHIVASTGGTIVINSNYSTATIGNSLYGNSDTVQPKATEMYLYFYVGQFTQTALENTAGLNTEMFNDLNAHKVIEYQAPTADNGYTWYRKYADGFVEQGGVYDLGSDVTVANQYAISLPVEMANTNYTGIAVPGGRTTGGQFGSYIVVNDTSNTTTAMFVYVFKTEQAYRYINWTVSGIAA